MLILPKFLSHAWIKSQSRIHSSGGLRTYSCGRAWQVLRLVRLMRLARVIRLFNLFKQLTECADDFELAFGPEIARREASAHVGTPAALEHRSGLRANLCRMETQEEPCTRKGCAFFHVWWRDGETNYALNQNLRFDHQGMKGKGKFIVPGKQPKHYR